MLSIDFIRQNKEKVAEAAQNKNRKVDIDRLLDLDERLKKLTHEIQELREERNNLAKLHDAEKSRERGKKIKDDLKKHEETLRPIEEELTNLLEEVPNVVHPHMPVGKDEKSNVVLRKWGELTTFDFKIKDHVELGELLDMIDIQTAGTVSGARFYFLKNAAVQIQFALIQYVFATLANSDIIKKIALEVGNDSYKPFSPILPPILMKAQVMKKMDRLDPIDDRFYFEKDDIVLVGSAEHTIGPYYIDKILLEKDLPIRYIGYSTAFRREAGSYGKDTRGILRVHQFDKLEMEVFSTPEQGEQEQALLVGIQEYMLQELGIPYQVVDVCTGDTGKPDYRQIDIECWIPSQGIYRETHSADFMTDYQARRLNTRYKKENGEKEFVYMNDATAFAIGRILIALLENNQQKDGSVTIPKVLQPFVGFDTIKPRI